MWLNDQNIYRSLVGRVWSGNTIYLLHKNTSDYNSNFGFHEIIHKVKRVTDIENKDQFTMNKMFRKTPITLTLTLKMNVQFAIFHKH